MRILVLNGSPRPKGSTKQMVEVFREGAESIGHQVDVIDVCKKKIAGCLACEYCHTKGNGVCVQKDDMQEVYHLLGEADMLVIASPIYYHGISGQLKCTLDRFYSAAYPSDFLEYLGLEDMGVLTAYGMENSSASKLKELRDFGRTLK